MFFAKIFLKFPVHGTRTTAATRRATRTTTWRSTAGTTPRRVTRPTSVRRAVVAALDTPHII